MHTQCGVRSTSTSVGAHPTQPHSYLGNLPNRHLAGAVSMTPRYTANRRLLERFSLQRDTIIDNHIDLGQQNESTTTCDGRTAYVGIRL